MQDGSGMAALPMGDHCCDLFGHNVEKWKLVPGPTRNLASAASIQPTECLQEDQTLQEPAPAPSQHSHPKKPEQAAVVVVAPPVDTARRLLVRLGLLALGILSLTLVDSERLGVPCYGLRGRQQGPRQEEGRPSLSHRRTGVREKVMEDSVQTRSQELPERTTSHATTDLEEAIDWLRRNDLPKDAWIYMDQATRNAFSEVTGLIAGGTDKQGKQAYLEATMDWIKRNNVRYQYDALEPSHIHRIVEFQRCERRPMCSTM
ncbi:expressed unknown protein [Seminavis robusta]|uniref:Uncharacterized protein n=1 Tax=Seminavis robusta TaxID=568900 RepID=A0A9N8F128_9STRA|nr:expressed unknown protein [Seminavis robusta]|eukprot:Sro2998_g341860.1 n/a (260) ;mRNA; r:1750-2529